MISNYQRVSNTMKEVSIAMVMALNLNIDNGLKTSVINHDGF